VHFLYGDTLAAPTLEYNLNGAPITTQSWDSDVTMKFTGEGTDNNDIQQTTMTVTYYAAP
jgi:hypothetical protein